MAKTCEAFALSGRPGGWVIGVKSFFINFVRPIRILASVLRHHEMLPPRRHQDFNSKLILMWILIFRISPFSLPGRGNSR